MRNALLNCKQSCSFYPTVVADIKDHQNPCQEPLMNERGNSSLFQYVSLTFQKQNKST